MTQTNRVRFVVSEHASIFAPPDKVLINDSEIYDVAALEIEQIRFESFAMITVKFVAEIIFEKEEHEENGD